MPSLRKTTPLFVEEAQRVHGEMFDYSEVEYVNTHVPVKIKCRQCGVVFMHEPASHLASCGCPKCSEKKTDRKMSLEAFIARAREAHCDKYDYNKTVYQDICFMFIRRRVVNKYRLSIMKAAVAG